MPKQDLDQFLADLDDQIDLVRASNRDYMYKRVMDVLSYAAPALNSTTISTGHRPDIECNSTDVYACPWSHFQLEEDFFGPEFTGWAPHHMGGDCGCDNDGIEVFNEATGQWQPMVVLDCMCDPITRTSIAQLGATRLGLLAMNSRNNLEVLFDEELGRDHRDHMSKAELEQMALLYEWIDVPNLSEEERYQ